MKTRYLKEHKPRKVNTPWMKGFTLPEKLDDLAISQLQAKKVITYAAQHNRKLPEIK